MSEYSFGLHIRNETHARMDCTHVKDQPGHKPYAVLHIGDGVTIWPSRKQLVKLRDAISAYLEAHPEPAPDRPLSYSEIEKIADGIAAEEAKERLEEDWFR